MTQTKISLVSPVLNEARTLQDTLSSVLAQTRSPFEHIIVDGGSTDGSLQIIEQYISRAPYPVILIQTPPTGVYAALNTGYNAATGNAIGLLHGDDFFSSPQVLEFVEVAMKRYPNVELFYGDVHYVDKLNRRARYYSGAHFQPSTLLKGFTFPHPSMYVRRRLWNRLGPYDESYRTAGDYEWITRATLKNRTRILYLPLDMVAMHEGGLAFQWSNRLFHNIVEKRKALLKHGFKAPLWRLMGRYLFLFKH